MAAPVVSSITVTRGRTRGETLVEINGTGFNDIASGGTVKVYFGTKEALRADLVNSTTILALTPGGEADEVVDVTVENVTPDDPNPPIVEPGTLPAAFTYKRPSLATPTPAAYDVLTVITRTLVKELKRCVLENTHHDMHPDYADEESALVPEEKQSEEAPSLKIIGPTVGKDQFYAEQTQQGIDIPMDPVPGPGLYEHLTPPVVVRLDYQYIGNGKTTGEAGKLWEALTDWFNRTPYLLVPQDGVNPANGTVQIEMSTVWEQQGQFKSEATRNGIYEFVGAFTLRGVITVPNRIELGATVFDAVTLEVDALPEDE